jgi:hypothetical protein
MDPRLGCWLFSFLSSRTNGSILAALGSCSREQFDEIQGQALKFILRLDEREGTIFPMPIVAPSGLWADKDLESDPSEVFKLTCECISFNLEPFLEESKSNVPS